MLPTRIAVVGSIWLTSGSILRLITPSPSTVGVKARPTPYFLNSIVMHAEVRRDRNGEFAAREEARGVARERRQVRLGEAAHDAALFQRLQQRVGLHAVAEHAAEHGAERRRCRRSSPPVPTPTPTPVPPARRFCCTDLPVHAELAAGGARSLDEAHFQHHLLRGIHLHRVDHVGAELLGDGHRLVDRHGVRRVAAQHDPAVDRGDAEARMRETLRKLAAEPRGVVGHLDVEHADQLLAFAVNRDARVADLLAEDRERAVGERDRVGDLRIADDHLGEAAFGCARFPTCRSRSSPSPRCGPRSARSRAPARGARPSGKLRRSPRVPARVRATACQPRAPRRVRAPRAPCSDASPYPTPSPYP